MLADAYKTAVMRFFFFKKILVTLGYILSFPHLFKAFSKFSKSPLYEISESLLFTHECLNTVSVHGLILVDKTPVWEKRNLDFILSHG